jgi:Protein of unknown function/Domain of unknown function (DUF1835)
MKTLHIASGYSAGGSLEAAIGNAGSDDELLKWPDDLSCGPIDPGTPEQRDAWLNSRDWDLAGELRAFWQRVDAAEKRLVVWFGRHDAKELAFFLNWADRMGDRLYDIIDVTGLEFPSARLGAGIPPTWRAKSVSILNAINVRPLLGSERPVTAEERRKAQECWRRLRSENAPFRIVTEDGLASAPIDHFDPLLLEQAATEWRKVAYVVGMTMGQNSEPYYQVGDLMLLDRLVALVEAGKLIADGNPWEMQNCRVRLAG